MNNWRNHFLITYFDLILKLTEIIDVREISMHGPYHKKFSPQRAAEKKMESHRVFTVFLRGSPAPPWLSVALYFAFQPFLYSNYNYKIKK